MPPLHLHAELVTLNHPTLAYEWLVAWESWSNTIGVWRANRQWRNFGLRACRALDDNDGFDRVVSIENGS